MFTFLWPEFQKVGFFNPVCQCDVSLNAHWYTLSGPKKKRQIRIPDLYDQNFINYSIFSIFRDYFLVKSKILMVIFDIAERALQIV